MTFLWSCIKERVQTEKEARQPKCGLVRNTLPARRVRLRQGSAKREAFMAAITPGDVAAMRTGSGCG